MRNRKRCIVPVLAAFGALAIFSAGEVRAANVAAGSAPGRLDPFNPYAFLEQALGIKKPGAPANHHPKPAPKPPKNPTPNTPEITQTTPQVPTQTHVSDSSAQGPLVTFDTSTPTSSSSSTSTGSTTTTTSTAFAPQIVLGPATFTPASRPIVIVPFRPPLLSPFRP